MAGPPAHRHKAIGKEGSSASGRRARRITAGRRTRPRPPHRRAGRRRTRRPRRTTDFRRNARETDAGLQPAVIALAMPSTCVNPARKLRFAGEGPRPGPAFQTAAPTHRRNRALLGPEAKRVNSDTIQVSTDPGAARGPAGGRECGPIPGPVACQRGPSPPSSSFAAESPILAVPRRPGSVGLGVKGSAATCVRNLKRLPRCQSASRSEIPLPQRRVTGRLNEKTTSASGFASQEGRRWHPGSGSDPGDSGIVRAADGDLARPQSKLPNPLAGDPRSRGAIRREGSAARPASRFASQGISYTRQRGRDVSLPQVGVPSL